MADIGPASGHSGDHHARDAAAHSAVMADDAARVYTGWSPHPAAFRGLIKEVGA